MARNVKTMDSVERADRVHGVDVTDVQMDAEGKHVDAKKCKRDVDVDMDMKTEAKAITETEGEVNAGGGGGGEAEEQWLSFRPLVTVEWLAKGKPLQSHINMAMALLHDVLVELFGEPRLNGLRHAEPDVNFFAHITSTFQNSVAKRDWKRPTATQVTGLLKAILQKIQVPSPVLRAFQLVAPERTNNPIIGRVGRLDKNDATRLRVEGWLQLLSQWSHNHSPGSQRNVIGWILRRFIPACGLRVDAWPSDPKPAILALCQNQELLDRVTKTDSRKQHWTEVFVNSVLELDIAFPKRVRTRTRRKREEEDKDNGNGNDEGDAHLISAPDLDRLQAVMSENAEDELLLVLLLTSGVRIGGYANLKVAEVADVVKGRWQVRRIGKTTEKGPKNFSFLIHPRAQTLLASWLNRHRGFDSNEYVFPGRFGYKRSTQYFRNRFKLACKKAGLQGKEFHLHSLRHCYAHMLKEAGNSTETIAKLINHSSAQTTQQHYLKESMLEVTQRANIPWMPKEPDAKPRTHIPNFLQKSSASSSSTSSTSSHPSHSSHPSSLARSSRSSFASPSTSTSTSPSTATSGTSSFTATDAATGTGPDTSSTTSSSSSLTYADVMKKLQIFNATHIPTIGKYKI